MWFEQQPDTWKKATQNAITEPLALILNENKMIKSKIQLLINKFVSDKSDKQDSWEQDTPACQISHKDPAIRKSSRLAMYSINRCVEVG